MLIDQERCTACGRCVPYCPVGAIHKEGKSTWIDLEECVECGNCRRSGSCPKDAIYLQELKWPRTIRRMLSDPLTITEEAGIAGRGTEEMKTNDVTGRIKRGQLGIGIEVGRPILGARLADAEKIARAVAKLGVTFEAANPLTSLMDDPVRGIFRPDVLQEKVLSGIIEFAIPVTDLKKLLDILQEVSSEIDSVFSLGVASRVNDDGTFITTEILDRRGIWHAPNGKCNVGLGRPLYKEYADEPYTPSSG
jgi:NAD-dependent dihydropyrimidine dehydrogenase PreA subunit